MSRLFDIPEEHVRNVLDKYEYHVSQLQVCEEECSELIKAISKHIRVLQKTTDVTTEEARAMIVEETTHVAVVLGMLRKIFNIKDDEIDDEIWRKANKEGFDDNEYSYLTRTVSLSARGSLNVGDLVKIKRITPTFIELEHVEQILKDSETRGTFFSFPVSYVDFSMKKALSFVSGDFRFKLEEDELLPNLSVCTEIVPNLDV